MVNKGKNFILVFGCSPGAGVNAASEFIGDTIKLYTANFDPESGEILVPDVYSEVVSRDAKFEVVTCVEAKHLILER